MILMHVCFPHWLPVCSIWTNSEKATKRNCFGFLAGSQFIDQIADNRNLIGSTFLQEMHKMKDVTSMAYFIGCLNVRENT